MKSHMVDRSGDLELRQVIPGNRTRDSGVHGCVDVRLGRSKRKPKLARQLAPPRVLCKLARVEDGLCSPPTPPIPVSGQDSPLSDRQFHGDGISPERGRHQVEAPYEADRKDITASEEAAEILLSLSRSGSRGSGRIAVPVAGRDRVRLSTDLSTSASSEKAQKATENAGVTESPVVTQREVVSVTGGNSERQGGGNSRRRC